MTAFTDLPPELILQILIYLPIQTIHVVEGLSTAFQKAINDSEEAVYRSAAILHGFVPQAAASNISPEELISETPDISDWMRGVRSWKELCQKHFGLEASWKGTVPEQRVPLKIIEAAGRHVHRFKVDEVERTVITSSKDNQGLIVASIDTLEVLWSLPSPYVAAYTHIEYDEGFIIFTRGEDGRAFEIWRRSADSFDEKTYLPCTPHRSQIIASPQPVPLFPTSFPPIYSDGSSPVSGSTATHRRGVYLPFALLALDVESRFSRFVYPELIFGSNTSKVASIWDVTTSRLVETLDIAPPLQGNEDGGTCQLRYVDISKNHVFVSWADRIVVYSRNPNLPTENVVFMATMKDVLGGSSNLSISSYPNYWSEGTYDSRPSTIFRPPPSTQVIQCAVREGLPPRSLSNLLRYGARSALTYLQVLPDDYWNALHVSPDGQDLVATTTSGQVIYVPNFASKERDPSCGFRLTMSAGAVSVVIPAIGYLAFDGIRILLATKTGLHSITVKDRIHPLGRPSTPEVQQLLKFPQRELLWVSCIQLLRGSAFLAYPGHVGNPPQDYLACVDLTAPLSVSSA